MLVDYHIHTGNSPDAKGDFNDYIQKAIERGIDEIGFSDHIILHKEKDYPCKLPNIMQNYVQKFLETKRKSTIPIRLGAEIDFFSEDIEKIREFTREYPFDYVIGSVHYIGHWSIDSRNQIGEYQKRNILQIYEEYFRTVRELAQSKLFDILGHADLIKIFGFKPNTNIDDILDETVGAIAENNLCVEINTSGLTKPCTEIYPSKQFLTILQQKGAKITLGSDSHNPNDTARDFDSATKLAKETGYKQICTFQNRKRKTVEI
jgi:histidinol-phosphatase (PHP family)